MTSHVDIQPYLRKIYKQYYSQRTHLAPLVHDGLNPLDVCWNFAGKANKLNAWNDNTTLKSMSFPLDDWGSDSLVVNKNFHSCVLNDIRAAIAILSNMLFMRSDVDDLAKGDAIKDIERFFKTVFGTYKTTKSGSVSETQFWADRDTVIFQMKGA